MTPSAHPHTRGANCQHLRRSIRVVRPIPTRVGQTPASFHHPAHSPAHPHTRGANAWVLMPPSALSGPSPHAWGKQGSSRRGQCPCPAHPHTRGANWEPSSSRAGSSGPSPHAWGKPWCRPPAGRRRRPIPTRVGQTLHPQPVPQQRDAAHPHTRGANGARAEQRPDQVRPIPTRVGQTTPSSPSAGSPSAHPHTRGANSAATSDLVPYPRPIPTRVGQTRPVSFPAAAPVRPIPTRVGQTWKPWSHTTRRPAHPHTRGANMHYLPARLLRPPAHPHTRGANVIRHDQPRTDHRPIPTRVGQTKTAPTEEDIYDGPSPHAWGKRAYGSRR